MTDTDTDTDTDVGDCTDYFCVCPYDELGFGDYQDIEEWHP